MVLTIFLDYREVRMKKIDSRREDVMGHESDYLLLRNRRCRSFVDCIKICDHHGTILGR